VAISFILLLLSSSSLSADSLFALFALSLVAVRACVSVSRSLLRAGVVVLLLLSCYSSDTCTNSLCGADLRISSDTRSGSRARLSIALVRVCRATMPSSSSVRSRPPSLPHLALHPAIVAPPTAPCTTWQWSCCVVGCGRLSASAAATTSSPPDALLACVRTCSESPPSPDGAVRQASAAPERRVRRAQCLGHRAGLDRPQVHRVVRFGFARYASRARANERARLCRRCGDVAIEHTACGPCGSCSHSPSRARCSRTL